MGDTLCTREPNVDFLDVRFETSSLELIVGQNCGKTKNRAPLKDGWVV